LRHDNPLAYLVNFLKHNLNHRSNLKNQIFM